MIFGFFEPPTYLRKDITYPLLCPYIIHKCSLLTSLIRHLLTISLKVAKSTSVFLSGISSLSKTTKLGNKSFSSLFNWGRSYLSEYSINQLMTIVKGGVIFLKNPNKYKIFSRRKQIFTK